MSEQIDLRFEVSVHFTMDSARVNSACVIADVNAANFGDAQRAADELAAEVAHGTRWQVGHVLISERARP